MSQNLYLVPHDFSPVGEAALRYAVHIGKRVKTEICIVHIVSDKAKLALAKKKVDEVIANAPKEVNIEYSQLIHVGNIFEDIGKIAKRERAQLIIMGTHGATGMQKLFGMNAIKVVTSANVPFLVVQKDTEPRTVKKIVVPIDMTKESLQIATVAGDLGVIFSAELHVVTEKQTDELLSRKLGNRLKIVKDQYDDRELVSHVAFLEGGGSFLTKILNYIKKENVDFIALAYHTESLFPQFDKFAQTLLTNEYKLPCVIINSKEASNMYF